MPVYNTTVLNTHSATTSQKVQLTAMQKNKSVMWTKVVKVLLKHFKFMPPKPTAILR